MVFLFKQVGNNEKYYQILGLEEDATLEELEKKYHDLLAEFDPKTQSEEGLKGFLNLSKIKLMKLT